MGRFTAFHPEICASSSGLATGLPHYTGAGSLPCALRYFLSPL